MNKTGEIKMKEYYGQIDQERLDNDPGDVVIALMEDEDYSDFPIKVYTYNPREVAKDAETFSRDILENILERLDEEYGDPDGDYTEPTDSMKKASLELAKVIFKDYQSFMCEETGEVIEFSKEAAEKIAGITP